MTTPTTQRFVSLYGFFAIEYPSHWKQETDESGQYIFSNDAGGSGVVRIIVIDNEYKGEDAGVKILEEVYNQNKAFSPSLLAAGKNRFVHFVKEHDVNGSSFTVYYWATAHSDKVVLLTYTIQTSMKGMPTPELEKQQLETMVASLEFMHDTVKHG
ncbi:MAG: DUF3805 domain-containing protein [Bacteroidota bacterium]